MRVVFFGTPAFAVPTLSALLDSPHEVVGVVTQPDRPRGRGQKVSHAPVKALAVDRGLPVLQPQRLTRDSFAADFTALSADLGVVAAYGKILPAWMLQAPRFGMINVHASLLPKYRGAAPVQRAVMNGDSETGVTIMRVVEALDAGPMMARGVRPIGPNEPSDVVERDLAELGAALLLTVVGDLAAGRAIEIPQDEAAATYAPRLIKEEGVLDFTHPAAVVHNRVRGLRPWPAAYTWLGTTRHVIHETRLDDGRVDQAEPGTCVAADAEGICIACGDRKAVVVLQLQAEGRRAMSARDYLAGHGGLVGQRFG
jgi:methionyl-tRNA formyltransferase